MLELRMSLPATDIDMQLQLPGVQEQVAPQLQLELPQCSFIVAFVAGMKQRNSKIERERE
jgi:hypothetical protein